MFRKFVLDTHLYVGIILGMTIIMLSVSGFYLNHRHDWFHNQQIQYLHPAYETMVKQARQSAQEGNLIVPEAVQKGMEAGFYSLSDIKSVDYANHGLGYFYYVYLKDAKETIVAVTQQGEIAKVFHDPLIKQWMYDLHVGIVDSFRFVFINDLTALGTILLTVTGVILSFRVLRARIKKSKRVNMKNGNING